MANLQRILLALSLEHWQISAQHGTIGSGSIAGVKLFMLTFVKLGGSLITDKRSAEHFNAETMRRAAHEIAQACAARPTLQVLIGHGSGSFGHVAAQKYGTAQGVSTAADWRGFGEVATVARRLNALVADALHEAALPIFGIQPSASALCLDGELTTLVIEPLRSALAHGLIPLVYGDVALDEVRGGTIISTETIFFYLAKRLQPTQIFLLGEVEGVYDANGVVIPHITPTNFEQIADALGGSHGTDVTGGMASKVRAMLTLAQQVAGLQIRIFGGTQPGQLQSALMDENTFGTLISDQ